MSSQDHEDPGRKNKKDPKRSKEKEANERFRSNLLSVVSHELNTPLTSILNAIALLEEKYPREEENIGMLKRNAERLRRTIENLLEISRVDAGTLRVRLSELDIHNFLMSRKEALANQVEMARFEMVWDLETSLPHLCGDFRRLAYVFDCLALNAIKFSNASLLGPGEKGKLFIKMGLEPISSLPAQLAGGKEKKTGMYIIVSLQSSLLTIGESPDSFEQLFEPFSPWRNADTRVREGLGVELAIAKEILLAHEGFLWADSGVSQDRKGWRFSFALPLLSRLDELELVTNNRLFTAIGALSKVSMILLRLEPGAEANTADQLAIFRSLQKALFRSSDSTFWIQDAAEFVVFMDDCDADGAERVARRLLLSLHSELPQWRFLWALATGPDDGSTARKLLEKARADWRLSN